MGGLIMSTLVASTEHADKLGDPEWVGALMAAVAGSSVAILKGYDHVRNRRRDEVDIGKMLVDQAAAVAELAVGMQSPLREELVAVRAEMAQAGERYRIEADEMRTSIAALQRENADLRTEVATLRSAQPFDRRQHGQ